MPPLRRDPERQAQTVVRRTEIADGAQNHHAVVQDVLLLRGFMQGQTSACNRIRRWSIALLKVMNCFRTRGKKVLSTSIRLIHRAFAPTS
jgi:hypothetical protein